MAEAPFSRRNRFAPDEPDIAVWEDAPESVRVTLLESGRRCGMGPTWQRNIVSRVLRVKPDPGSWSEYPNVWEEVQGHVYGCPWFKVYDLIEAYWKALNDDDDSSYRLHPADRKSSDFTTEINQSLVDERVGWQLVNGLIVSRGPETFETVVHDARAALSESQRPTAAGHIGEALAALSRRPAANYAGAIYHAMGALECVARDVSGREKATLGEILKWHPELLPKPLDEALSKVWGYVSNESRHVREGRDPTRADAELVVGLAAAVATYLTRKAAGA